MSQSPDPGGLAEFSVVFTDRALNHMSARFQGVMRGLSRSLKQVYSAHAVAIVPGGGTFAMEAVARQLTPAAGPATLVVRNGWFSFRWSQILDAMGAPEPTVCRATQIADAPQAPFSPPAADAVAAAIATHRPPVVFVPHVETSAGMVVPDGWIRTVAAATHAVGGLLVLDCIASGALWVDMADLGVDVLISAPQKGWSAPAAAGLVLLSEAATERVKATQSSSFAADLGRWLGIMEAYEGGGHAYHATLPTDALAAFADAVAATEAFGFAAARTAQLKLGARVRALLAERGYPSVAAPGFEAPGVVVCYAPNEEVRSGRAFLSQGVQVAGGVPLRCGERADFATFRIGLFGLDKLQDPDGTVARLAAALDGIGAA